MLSGGRGNGNSTGSRGLPDIEWVLGDATRLPFPDASFDAATMGYGLRNVRTSCQQKLEMSRCQLLTSQYCRQSFAVKPSIQAQALTWHGTIILCILQSSQSQALSTLPNSTFRAGCQHSAGAGGTAAGAAAWQ